jgi:membrane protein DedA with SNARE-associated domain
MRKCLVLVLAVAALVLLAPINADAGFIVDGGSMENFVDEFGHFIETHRNWAPPLIGLLAFGESLVLVGLFIPATPMMILVGGLIGSGALPPIPVLVCAIIGAILGDIVSYALGRLAGRRTPSDRWA